MFVIPTALTSSTNKELPVRKCSELYLYSVNTVHCLLVTGLRPGTARWLKLEHCQAPGVQVNTSCVQQGHLMVREGTYLRSRV